MSYPHRQLSKERAAESEKVEGKGIEEDEGEVGLAAIVEATEPEPRQFRQHNMERSDVNDPAGLVAVARAPEVKNLPEEGKRLTLDPLPPGADREEKKI